MIALITVMSLFTPCALASPAEAPVAGNAEGYNAQAQTFDGKQIVSRTEFSSVYTDEQLIALAEAGTLIQSGPVKVTTRQAVSEDGLFVDGVVRIERTTEQMVLEDGATVERIAFTEITTRASNREFTGDDTKAGIVRVYTRMDTYLISVRTGGKAYRPLMVAGKAEKLNSNVAFSSMFLKCQIFNLDEFDVNGNYLRGAVSDSRTRSIASPSNNAWYDRYTGWINYYGGHSSTTYTLYGSATIYYTYNGSSSNFMCQVVAPM